jgi:hypothetical protein
MIDQETEVMWYASNNGDFQEVFNTQTFTRSNGTVFSRIYERLTKASRRRADAVTPPGYWSRNEEAYRAGVKDTLEALRSELS